MKIISIISIGTFWSPWFPYTVASVYNISDEIIIANSGFSMDNPNPKVLVPLERVSTEIKRLDINGKITELKNIDPNKLEHKMELITQYEADHTGRAHNDDWCDPRGFGITAANEEANRRNPDWILKIDTDQACFKDVENLRKYLEKPTFTGLTFYQYEFAQDIYHLSNPGPDSEYNDSVFVYLPVKGQYYGGGMGPCLMLPGQDRTFFPYIHAAHLRYANPTYLTDEEKFQHFYGRKWFSDYTNVIGKFGSELNEYAKLRALETLKNPSVKPANVPPPEVTLLKDPLEYIK